MDDLEARLRDLGERTDEQLRAGVLPRQRIVRRARLRRAFVVGAPVVAAAVLSAVVYPLLDGKADRPETSIAMLTGAIDATEDQGTARIEVEFEFEMGSEVVSSRSSGVIDFGTGLAHSQVTYVDDGQEHAVEIVTDGTTTFERPLDPPGAKWYEPELPPGAPAGPPDSSPAEFLRYVESVASKVTRAGVEVRNGVSVTRYVAVLDPAKVAAASGREALEGVEVELDPMDVWVDRQGRVREATFGATTTLDDFSQTVHGSLRFFDFGTPVDVEMPDPDEITDERPSALGTGDGDSVSGEDGDGELDEFGVGEIFTVAGADALSGPHAVVTLTEGRDAICIQGVPAMTTRSSIVEAGSGDPVVSVPGDATETNPYARGGCTDLTHEVIDGLRMHPELFELRFDRAGRPDMVVPLSQSF